MKKHLLTGGALLGVLLTPAAFATTATSLSSFEGMEDPIAQYHPLTDTMTFTSTFVNITDQGSGTFRFTLRFRKDQWWDGDRDTTLEDRGRAEVKGLGAHQKV